MDGNGSMQRSPGLRPADSFPGTHLGTQLDTHPGMHPDTHPGAHPGAHPALHKTGWISDLSLTLARHKLRTFGLVAGAGIVAAACALLLPSVYEASTKILLPQQTPSIASMFGSSSLAGLAGGSHDLSAALKNPTDIYVSMLQSRTIADAIISRFHLMSVYKSRRQMDCRKTLSGNVVVSTEKGNVISITVDDREPRRSAEIANGFVTELTTLNQRLAVSEAAQRRIFFEAQLGDEREALVAAEGDMLDTQRSSKLIAPESQTKATMEGIARLREEIAEHEVQLRMAQTYATDRNANVQRLAAEVAGLRDQLARFERQSEAPDDLLPTSKLPQAGLDYLRRAREIKYHESVMEILLRQFEAAKLDESRQAANIQILDLAVTPEFRVRPHRKTIVALACLLALLLSVCWSIGDEILERARTDPALSLAFERQLDGWLGTERRGVRTLAKCFERTSSNVHSHKDSGATPHV